MRYSLLLLLLLWSCDSKRVFEDFHTIEGSWSKDEPYVFEFDVADPTLRYNLLVHIKQEVNYRFNNFYFQYRLATSADSLLVEKLEELILFDPKSGEPLGRGVAGSFDNTHLLLGDFRFPEKGKYQITFEQFMRVDELADLTKVGFRLETVN